MPSTAYAPPELCDYGSLSDLTRATALFGSEDMTNKAVPNHHVPRPSGPAGP